MPTSANPLGLCGVAFIELASDDPARVEALLRDLGFSRTRRHRTLAVDHWTQGDIRVLLNRDPGSHAAAFRRLHGPSIPTLGLRVVDPEAAFVEAVRRGAQPFEPGPGRHLAVDAPAIVGLGGSLIQLVGDPEAGTLPHPEPVRVPSRGFVRVDHLTNNVEAGTLGRWADFYRHVFGFIDVRTFDIRGEHTGLVSFALQSPCGSFCLPINEGTEAASQIEEYLREYRGPGIQHVALLSADLLTSLDGLGGRVPTLDIDAGYYETAFDRVPGVIEDRRRIARHQVLVDGDREGYLLQIFTKNLVGPIFLELIQRRNHRSFGEGNFSALFRSIERDQERRGAFESDADVAQGLTA